MPTILKTKNSVTTTVAPTTLQQGELAVNITDKKMWVGNAATTPVQILGAGTTGTAAGSNTQVQYNSSGTLAGDANFTFNGTTVTMTNDASISGLTVGKGGGAVASNTAVGFGALLGNTTQTGNTSVGYGSLYANSGNNNSSFGYATLNVNGGNNNSAFGYLSLTANTGGSNNSSFGVGSLQSNTTASNNTAVGYQAGYSNTTGTLNTAVGFQSLYANTTGRNTGIGSYVLLGNTTGTLNTSVGDSSMQSNTTGGNNVALGVSALQANTTASNNTAVGYQAGYSNTTGALNSFFGRVAGYSNTASANNFFGQYVGYANTTGTENSAFGGSAGSSALQANSTGSYNSAFGNGALASNTTASNNTAVGYQAGYTNATGSSNAFFGYQAGYASTDNNNTAMGYRALYAVTGAYYQNTAIGSNAGLASTTGYNNTFIGQNSGSVITTGANNTILGRYTGNQGGLDIRTASNYIVLSDGDGNPRVYYDTNGLLYQNTNYNFYRIAQFQNTNNTSGNGTIQSTLGSNCNNTASYHFLGVTNALDKIYIHGNGNIVNVNNSYGTLSDVKLKENIVDATPKLDKILQLQVRNFNLKSDPDLKQIGFIAQEFEQVFPSMVDETQDRDADGNNLETTTKSIKTSVLVPILVKAIQELKAEVDSLKQQLGK
jgi:trimeric autotransporter adhesin